MKTVYDKLKEIYKSNPELTFQNDGYEYLPKEVKDANKEAIAEIESLLDKAIAGFSRFDNFNVRKDGTIMIRVQYRWSEYFTGVGYFPIDGFKHLEDERD